MKKSYTNRILFNVLIIFLITNSCTKDESVEVKIPIIKGNLNLQSQQEIDMMFKSGLEVIEGDLIIGSEFAQSLDIEINSLVSMRTLKEVKGKLMIRATKNLKNLKGLQNLEKIGGSFRIEYNKDLTEIEGLDKLNNVGGNVIFDDNRSLEDINGFKLITSLSGSLRISKNYELENFSGFESLNTISRNLEIQYNRKLKNLDNLKSLSSIGTTLMIDSNLHIENITGLKNLSSVGNNLDHTNWGEHGSIYLTNNPSLVNLEGLEKIKKISGQLILKFNDSMLSLKGLNNLNEIFGEIEISYNDQLNSLEALLSLKTVQHLFILNNPRLVSLKGLDNLKYHYKMGINIVGNKSLTDFCAIENFVNMIDCDFSLPCHFFSPYDNAYNPEFKDIKNGKCKQ